MLIVNLERARHLSTSETKVKTFSLSLYITSSFLTDWLGWKVLGLLIRLLSTHTIGLRTLKNPKILTQFDSFGLFERHCHWPKDIRNLNGNKNQLYSMYNRILFWLSFFWNTAPFVPALLERERKVYHHGRHSSKHGRAWAAVSSARDSQKESWDPVYISL
jgi:hypothetical protein